jgi:putative membrane protein
MNTAKYWMRPGLAMLLAGMLISCERNHNVQAARENADNQAISESDRQFLIEAEHANIKERNLGRVALEKSQNGAVRDYAQMLIDDHNAALRDLVDLMQNKGMRQPDSLPEVKHEALERLDDVFGSEFDRHFIRLMVEEHQKAVAKFRNRKALAMDGDVREYASRVLPALEKHLKRAEELQQSLAGSTTG